eukprot:3461987-Rhodomonas_salina.2
MSYLRANLAHCASILSDANTLGVCAERECPGGARNGAEKVCCGGEDKPGTAAAATATPAKSTSENCKEDFARLRIGDAELFTAGFGNGSSEETCEKVHFECVDCSGSAMKWRKGKSLEE